MMEEVKTGFRFAKVRTWEFTQGQEKTVAYSAEENTMLIEIAWQLREIKEALFEIAGLMEQSAAKGR